MDYRVYVVYYRVYVVYYRVYVVYYTVYVVNYIRWPSYKTMVLLYSIGETPGPAE